MYKSGSVTPSIVRTDLVTVFGSDLRNQSGPEGSAWLEFREVPVSAWA
jgi:hypothetical protein